MVVRLHPFGDGFRNFFKVGDFPIATRTDQRDTFLDGASSTFAFPRFLHVLHALICFVFFYLAERHLKK